MGGLLLMSNNHTSLANHWKNCHDTWHYQCYTQCTKYPSTACICTGGLLIIICSPSWLQQGLLFSFCLFAQLLFSCCIFCMCPHLPFTQTHHTGGLLVMHGLFFLFVACTATQVDCLLFLSFSLSLCPPSTNSTFIFPVNSALFSSICTDGLLIIICPPSWLPHGLLQNCFLSLHLPADSTYRFSLPCINQHFPRAVTQRPWSNHGLKISNLSTEQLVSHILILLKFRVQKGWSHRTSSQSQYGGFH